MWNSLFYNLGLNQPNIIFRKCGTTRSTLSIACLCYFLFHMLYGSQLLKDYFLIHFTIQIDVEITCSHLWSILSQKYFYVIVQISISTTMFLYIYFKFYDAIILKHLIETILLYIFHTILYSFIVKLLILILLKTFFMDLKIVFTYKIQFCQLYNFYLHQI